MNKINLFMKLAFLTFGLVQGFSEGPVIPISHASACTDACITQNDIKACPQSGCQSCYARSGTDEWKCTTC
jgi:hypothetical protein